MHAIFYVLFSLLDVCSIGLNPIGDTGAKYIALAVEQNKSESVKEI